MLLCDAASAVEGKLYILGGGWSQIVNPDQPTNMAIAVKIAVPWDQSNDTHRFRLHLITADGDPVEVADRTVEVTGEFEVGRPPGLARGTPLDAVFAVTFPALLLPADAYVWELEVGGEAMGRVPFRVGAARRR
jgi:hypothetical protein